MSTGFVHNYSDSARVILAVAIDTPLRRVFDYRAPPHCAADVRPGQRVWVPFGRRRVVGVVTALRQHSDVPPEKLRAALEIIDEEPTLDPALLALLTWSADYYRHPIGEVIAAALPAPLRQGAPFEEVDLRWRLTPAGRDPSAAASLRRAPKLRAILEMLVGTDGARREEIAAATGGNLPALRKLAARGLIEQYAQRPRKPPAPTHLTSPGPELSAAQRCAVEQIENSLGTFQTWLLHGVTGSGKTEVYLRVIDRVLTRGAQALVLVPEIALTPQLVARFRTRFRAPLAIMHSALSEGERLAAWRAARSGEARIVIGTRSAVFVPLAELGLIVIDEEHDASFKQQEGFRYSARDLAIVRAQRARVPVVLGSATPSLESLARARRQPHTHLRLTERAGGAQPPRWTLVDLRQHGAAQGIATPVLTAMQRHLERGNQVLLFLNRRGYAPVLFCPKCGWSAHCARCDAHLTVYRRPSSAQTLQCHHCGAEARAVDQCPTCSARVKPVGQGTERIEETIAQLFPHAPLARIDRDSMRRKGELESTLAAVNRNEIALRCVLRASGPPGRVSEPGRRRPPARGSS